MTLALWTLTLALQVAANAPAKPAKVTVAKVKQPATVSVVVYSDFQCPFCARFAGPLREAQAKGAGGSKIDLQFKHFPITAIHPAAQLAHQAALAAKAQGKFWEMHDLLFSNQRQAQRADLLGYAKTLGLDLARFERDMDSEAIKKVIAADVAEGTRLGISGTPTFFVNGKPFVGSQSLAQLEAIVAASKQPAAPPSAIRAAAQPASTAVGTANVASAADTNVPASVDLVLYSDFQCPFCQQFSGPFRDLQTKGADGTKVNVQFKNFPLSIHPNAQLAHQAAMAAKAQGKFWEMHDLLFANQQRAQRADLISYAKTLGLDVVQFEKDMDSDAVKRAIAADVAEGTRAGVTGTPSFTVNGRMYSGTRSLAQMKEMLGGAQRRARALAEIGDSMLSQGPSDASLTIELFADLQSPVSRQAFQVLETIAQQYPAKVRIQFRNFPLAFHPQAPLAHEAAMAAAREGRFWEMAAFVLEHQDTLREQDLVAQAGRLGLDVTKFAAALQEHRYAPRVEADVSAGQSRGVRGSPAILIGAKRIDGVPSPQALAHYIESALATSPSLPGSQTP